MGQHPAEAWSVFHDIICTRLRVIDKSDVPESSYSDEDEIKAISNKSPWKRPVLNVDDVKVNKYSQQEEFKHQTYSTHCEEEQDVLLMMKTFQTAGRSGSVSSSQVRRGIKNEGGRKERQEKGQNTTTLTESKVFLHISSSGSQLWPTLQFRSRNLWNWSHRLFLNITSLHSFLF